MSGEALKGGVNVRKHRWLKWLAGILGVLIILIIVIIIFISPIAKYLIEKYDVKYTGRQITMSWMILNPFTGYIHISKLKVFEQNSDSVFFSADGISADISVLKLISKKYEVSSFSMTNPVGKIIKNGDRFNYTDILEKFSKKEVKPPKKPAEPLKYKVGDVEIKNGTFYYIEKGTPVNYFIKKMNFSSSGLSWNVDSVTGNFSFQPGTGEGDIKGNFMVNLKSLDYRLAVLVNKFDLKIFEQYLRELSSYGSFTANLDADVKLKGSFKDQLNIDARGKVAINDFHFGKKPGDDYLSFTKLSVGIGQLNPRGKKYIFDSIILNKPYFRYEKYDTLDNVSKMFGKGGSNIKKVNQDPQKVNLILELAKYVEKLAKQFLHSYYKIDKFAVVDADLKFNDYSLREKFSMAMNPFNILADSMDKNNKRVYIDVKSGIKPYGNMTLSLGLDPQNNSNFELKYSMNKVSLAMFNPYTVTYTSFPIDRGSLEFNGNWLVRDGNINSKNHLVVIDPRTTKRVKKKDAKWIPTPLIMAFVRERGNVIDYEIPITGNLNSPKFDIWDVVGDLIKNIFVKPVTTGYRVEVKNVESEIEKTMKVTWQMGQATLESDQEDFLKKVVKFVKKDDKVKLNIDPVIYEEKEKENILLFQAKKKYFLANNGKAASAFSKEDSINVDKMSVKDPGFMKYLKKMAKDSMIFTVQQRCQKIVDEKKVEQAYTSLNNQRKENFINYFKKEGISDRVTMEKGKTGIPFNGFSFFEINYKGDYPDDVKKAYAKLNELNEKNPRKKFQKEHKSTLKNLFKR